MSDEIPDSEGREGVRVSLEGLVDDRIEKWLIRTGPEHTEDLQRLVTSFHKRHAFEVGQLVQWKPGLRNRLIPRHGLPAVVIDVLDEAVFDNAIDSGTPFFREPLDLIVGVLDDDGDLDAFYVDSRRFEPFRGPPTARS